MKNKKSLLSLGLLALVLVLGVGYAVVNKITLTFNGEATVGEADLKVAITAVTSSTDENVEKSFSDKEGTFKVSNMTLEQEVTFTFTVTNKETDIVAKLTDANVVKGNTEYFTATYVVNDGDAIQPGDSATVVVTVKMVKTPVTENDSKAEFTYTLNAVPVN